jgi:hypothetical protein
MQVIINLVIDYLIGKLLHFIGNLLWSMVRPMLG